MGGSRAPLGFGIPSLGVFYSASLGGRVGQAHLAGKHLNLQLFLFLTEEAGGGRRNEIKQMKGVVELRKNNLFFMSLLTL